MTAAVNSAGFLDEALGGREVHLLGKLVNYAFFVVALIVLPIAPFALALITSKRRFALEYYTSVKRCLTHLGALWENKSVERYVVSLLRRSPSKPRTPIAGHCTRCGNCCLDRRCLFLEKSGTEFLCGIYGHWLRDLTSCGAYPISQQDIDLYACPTYYVIKPTAIGRKRPANEPVGIPEVLGDGVDVVNL
jgi:hypothetical protein